MSIVLECKKMKRTGIFPAFLAGGVAAAAIPVMNMAIRSEMFVSRQGSPIHILLNENWSMMAMLNILLVVAGACLMYHTEYADNAIQRIGTLPTTEERLFSGKAVLLSILCIVLLSIEAVGIAFCSRHWFELSDDVWMGLMKNFGYALLLILPTALCSLFIASACKNMWVSLGIGIVCVFTATMVPAENYILSLFPFALPFQMFAGATGNTVCNFMIAAVIEIFIVGIVEVLFLKIRRSFE